MFELCASILAADFARLAEDVQAAALAVPDVQPFLEGKTVKKVIAVKNIVNIVVA